MPVAPEIHTQQPCENGPTELTPEHVDDQDGRDEPEGG
jgi:hypothetical protein